MIFRGVVKGGVGRFAKELRIPGASEISAPIRDWPEKVHPGTLNVFLEEFPEEFVLGFGEENVRLLDSRRFSPEAELLHHEIENNTLPPTPQQPDRGNAQVWRATLRSDEAKIESLCWVLRRIGSGLSKALECVAGEHLRKKMRLADGDRVTLAMEGIWRE